LLTTRRRWYNVDETPHFDSFVEFLEQTAIISLNGINQFLFGMEIHCVFTSGKIRIFKYLDNFKLKLVKLFFLSFPSSLLIFVYVFLPFLLFEQDSLVGIVTKLGLKNRKSWLIPSGGTLCSETHPASSSIDTWWQSWRRRRSGRQANHVHPASTGSYEIMDLHSPSPKCHSWRGFYLSCTILEDMSSNKKGMRQFKFLNSCKYLGTTLTNQNSIQEEIKCKLKSGNACYHSVQNLCLPVCYP
jgi:hypothetical protein